mmetsp:Transcript_93782/g.146440  ORF Transcript_93782/g.146440 Transcript_93782/m.146440 type:complete len:1057 (-) Transcript_93782:94-3264(-)
MVEVVQPVVVIANHREEALKPPTSGLYRRASLTSYPDASAGLHSCRSSVVSRFSEMTQGQTERDEEYTRHSAGRWKAEALHRPGVHIDGSISVGIDQEFRSDRGKRRLGRIISHYSRIIVDSKYVVFFSVMLTIYALMGDDFRVLCTEKPADIVFNIVTIICIVFFFTEIILSCLGKTDYFFGFFFWLDSVATVTLALDLTWVNDMLFNQSESMDLGDRARSGRTARVGASVGRMVRVLRLIRIFKLYKAYYAAKSRQAQAKKTKKKLEEKPPESQDASMKSPQPGAGTSMFDDTLAAEAWAEEQEEQMDKQQNNTTQESLVGKKLSALTIRRVIILVLAMLLILPTLSVADPITPTAPQWAADMIHQAYVELEQGIGVREIYERAMLKAIYYHNWYTGQNPCATRGCPSDYNALLFWIGAVGQDADVVVSRLATTQAGLSAAGVADYQATVVTQDDLYNYGGMPQEVLPLLTQDWTLECDMFGFKHYGISLLGTTVGDLLTDPIRCPDSLRPTESLRITPRMLTKDQYKAFHFIFFFDIRSYVKTEALFGIFTTLFICFVLTISSLVFSSDANRLVLHPVEKMIHKIEAIRANPLVAMKMADEEFKAEEVKKMKAAGKEARRFQRNRYFTRLASFSGKNPTLRSSPKNTAQHALQTLKEWVPKPAPQEMYETVILEKTIIKLGWLLSLVFGEAGAGIVSHNMSGNATAGVNAMVVGNRVDCIIGHARIRNFSTATEVLQGKVMTFVNQVAEIVHGVVDSHHGAANQNNGNTFLLIWRRFGMDYHKVSKLGDLAVLAFAKILGAIHRSPVLAGYRAHPGLQQRLGSDHKVSMSVGLHAGWAIEGAVGSEFKIDASYLSPNVKLADSLERATKEYGVSFLTSQAVVRLCNKPVASKTRLIDKVMLAGFTQPLDLYTLDLDIDNVRIDQPIARMFHWPNVRERFRARQFLEAEKQKKFAVDHDVAEEAYGQQDILEMREIYTFEFLCLFNRGYQNYSQGEWQVAKRVLSQTCTMLGVKDGPSLALLNFMEANASAFNFAPPEGWNGVRSLSVAQDPDL